MKHGLFWGKTDLAIFPFNLYNEMAKANPVAIAAGKTNIIKQEFGQYL